MRLTLIIICLGLIAFACDDNSTSSRTGYFRVRVIDTNNQPVEGVTLHGGFDWDEFYVTTGPDGYARVPEYGWRVYTFIYKNNYYTTYTSWLESRDYTISRCPFQLSEIGDVDGKAIKITDNLIATASYQGIYHLYEYSDAGISELSNAQLPHPFKDFQLFGDTLWYSTHDDGIYVYLIDELTAPREIIHYEISGYLKPFARKDSILAIGPCNDFGPIRIFSIHTDGSFIQLSQIQNFLIDSLAFIGNSLVALGNYWATPQIFDLSDPGNITLVYNGVDGTNYDSIVSGDSIIIFPSLNGHVAEYYDHMTLKLDNPRNPTIFAPFQVQGRLAEIINDSTAIGIYYSNNMGAAVFHKENSRYQAVAIISESMNEFQGARPPYFIIDGKLYKLTSFE